MDVLEDQGRRDREELHWLIAVSPYNPSETVGRYQALEKARAKATGIDRFMDRLIASKKLGQG